jgi:hypothetical protein
MDALAFRSNLLDALRSGHGLRARLETEVTSGPNLTVSVRAIDPASARWFSRIATGVYGPHQWERGRTLLRPVTRDVRTWVARRVFSWPEPLVAAGVGSAFDSFVGALRASPPGGRLRFDAVPLVDSALGWWARLPPDVTRPRVVDPYRHREPMHEMDGAQNSGVASRPLFWRLWVTLELESGSPAAHGPGNLPTALESASRTFRGNGLHFRPRRTGRPALPVGGDSIVVTLEELAALWPSVRCEVGITPPALSGRSELVPLGRTADGAVTGPTFEAHQGRHIAVLGETGMGKSSLLVALTRRVFRGSGGVVFDPLGETARSLRGELAPADRARTLWVAPDALEIGFNALEGIGDTDDAVRSERRLNDLVHALRRVRAGRYTDSGYWGPRLEEMVTRALRAAASLPEGTLLDAHTLLATSTRVGKPVPSSAIEAVRELADRIRDRPEDADGARRLLHEVVRNPVLSRMLCTSRPTVRTRDLVRPGRIVLLSGDAARVGETTARYLLSVLLALVWSELLSRPEAAKTFVVLDEAQWFSNDSLAEMLRLGRRKNVHVVLATQAIASLPESVGEAVWTNVSDFVAFRGSPEEAREFARVAPGVSAEALLSLPRGEAAVLIGKGEQVRWVRTIRWPAHPAAAGTESWGSGAPEEDSPEDDETELAGPAGRLGASGLDQVLGELLRLAATEDPSKPLIVSVPELRQKFDPGGEGARQAGGILSRSGALTRTERSSLGRVWVIDRARLAASCAKLTDLAGAEVHPPAPLAPSGSEPVTQSTAESTRSGAAEAQEKAERTEEGGSVPLAADLSPRPSVPEHNRARAKEPTTD